jgi:hypothetical protein
MSGSSVLSSNSGHCGFCGREPDDPNPNQHGAQVGEAF